MAGKTPKKTRAAAKARATVIEASEAAPTPGATINAAFAEDAQIRGAFSENLSVRAKEVINNATRARDAFTSFAPSRFTQREREPRRYLSPSDSLATTLKDLVLEGLNRRRTNDKSRGLKIARPTDDTQATDLPFNLQAQTIPLLTLYNYLTLKVPAAPTLREDPAASACLAKAKVQRRIDQIEGKKTAVPATVEKRSGDGGDSTVEAKALVSKQVEKLFAHLPSPEEAPVLRRPVAADSDDPHENVQNFELRTGPTDVTAYHDFNSLQIAFEHVWSEIFDERLGNAGRELYNAYVDLLDFVGNPIDPKTGQPIQPPKAITSVEDIANLVQNASMIGRVVDYSSLPNGVPADVMKALEDLRTEFIKLLRAASPIVAPTDYVAAGLIAPLMEPFKKKLELLNQAPGDQLAQPLDVVKRLRTMLLQMVDMLSKPYAFTVYQERSCNFGIMVTYRQAWEPEQYQVGDLVSTVPLAPREVRRYTTKQVTKRSRAVKEIANNLNSFRNEIDTTGRADRDIVNRAENRTNFKVTADGSFGTDANKIHATAEGGGDTARISESTKKDFHEAVLKSAREYKQDNRTEVDTTSSEESETTTYNEIQNPNDELTVTYLFYELQRTYRISEKIHQVVPVVLVANKVPAPHEIDDAWLTKHDWILRRVLLDDSFRSALEYLAKSFVGDELNLQILDNNVRAQRQVVDTIKGQVAAQLSIVDAAQRDLSATVAAKGTLEFAEGFLNTVKNVFDPLKLTGQTATGTKEGIETVANYAQESLERAEREKMRFLDQLALANTALQAAVDKLATATREHYDKVAEIDRLRLHVKENILYYMQAIWNHEPPDQRYFRVFETLAPVPVPLPGSMNIDLPVGAANSLADTLQSRNVGGAKLPVPQVEIQWKRLVEIADLDNVLGYKGNYAIYRLRENNYLTLHMMQDYLELSDDLRIRDPDDFSNYSVDQLQQLATCLYNEDRDLYDKHKEEIREWMTKRLMSGRPEDDRVIVPTKSLYMEALVGTHPLLEDFKLLHRAVDVKKAQGEVRRAELENIRLAARALEGEREDPDIDRKIVVEARDNPAIVVQPEP